MSHLLLPSFDVAHYLAYNPDLALSPADAVRHYDEVGRNEGRVASPLALRENLIGLIDDGRSVLEIGPFCSPLLRGPNIAYLDILDADQLRARASEIGIDPAHCPETIDYVGGLEQVSRRFDAVVSSHAIEHQPDLILHLSQVERILEPDGLFCLMIPDKRYCLDHHIAESTIAGILQAHREKRRRHSLASVIEHVALTTHNDPARHWAGDHGPAVPPDRAARIRNAVASFETSGNRYIDVHAWYFTPDNFRTIIEGLGALRLTGLEIAGVYDTARDRNEFCAVLQLDPAARQRARGRSHGGQLLVIQTADAFRYAPMLAVTGPNVTEYCRRHGHAYESFVGIKRGAHPWQATFNRILMLAEIAARGFDGWVLYLDADAYIQDLDFDLSAYLADKSDRAAIFATSGVSDRHWDVNAGVALINLGHPLGRSLVAQWAERFARHSDEFLHEADVWIDVGNDQDLLHAILREDADLAAAVLVESMAFINGPHASFIRQHLRTLSPDFATRIETLAHNVAEVAEISGAEAGPGSPATERWTARLFHRRGIAVELAEAAAAEPRVDLVAPVLAAWQSMPAEEIQAGLPSFQTRFAAALSAGDGGYVATEIAGLGRSEIGQGFFGGRRQHQRASDKLFAQRLARWTHDRLVALAEAVGALPVENPEGGRWDENAQIDPVELFRRIEQLLGLDLSPPAHVGGQLGVRVDRGIVLHARMIDAIHAGWRMRQFADAHGFEGGLRIAELGGGSGLNAYYAGRFGLNNYRLFDQPAMGVIQAYLLLGAGLDVGLNTDRPLAVLPWSALEAQPHRSIDLLFNADSLPDMADATEKLASIRAIGVPHLLSINQEAEQPNQRSVASLLAETGGYRLAARHRHWLRQGYVEEHYVASGARDQRSR